MLSRWALTGEMGRSELQGVLLIKNRDYLELTI